MAGVQATVTNLSINQNGNGNGTAINGSDAARLMVSTTAQGKEGIVTHGKI
jgi:hypothetical protein